MNFNSLCGGRIKEIRLKLGLSQEEIALKAGVSREMWGKYERGQSIPGGEVLFSFASVGADIQYILTGLESAQSKSSLAPREIALLKNFSEMKEEDKCVFEHLSGAIRKASE